jgi:hypothetical protein
VTIACTLSRTDLVERRTGKAASTIRYYEEIGLISPPERISGRRRYPTEIVRDDCPLFGEPARLPEPARGRRSF